MSKILSAAAGLFFAAVMPVEASAAYYGAIAYSSDTGSVGWSYNLNSRGAAESVAMNGCQPYASDCEIAIYFYNACGALAQAPDGAWGSGWGSTRRRAEHEAMKVCSGNGDGCHVIRWVCTAH